MEHPENDSQYKGLKVNKGIENVPTVNPYLKKRVKRRTYTPSEFVEGILKGDITILSQAVTLVESAKHEHQQIAQEVIEKCLPHAGKSIRVGITGVPGAGKSTSIDVFGMHLINQGHKLAVLAIDPSSERSKGSILGDKTRMEALSREKDAFIRPSPSAGSLGGVARKTRETIVLCEAAGFDTIFVETVGVGQSEVAVSQMVDCFTFLALSGAGDQLQGIKKGVLEMAELVAINKADGANEKPAKRAARDLAAAMRMVRSRDELWHPPTLTMSAVEGNGVAEFWDKVQEHHQVMVEAGEFEDRRRHQQIGWMWQMVHETIRLRLANDPGVKDTSRDMERMLRDGTTTPTLAAQNILAAFDRI